MKIAADPNWSFLEALDAAWKAYSGGVQYGAPNRIRVLEQWANVVGRETATQQLEDAISQYSTLDAATEGLGLTAYALRKLRKSFAGMPSLTPFSTEPMTLHDLLIQLYRFEGREEIELLEFVIPRLARCLDFALHEVYLERSVTEMMHADALFWTDGAEKPHVVVELKSTTRFSAGNLTDLLQQYVALTAAEYGFLLAPGSVVVVSQDGSTVYPLDELTEEHSKSIEAQLRNPGVDASVAQRTSAPLKCNIAALLEAVESSGTNDEKKKSLEVLAERVFAAHSFIRCRYKNLRTRSSEIDLVCEFLGTQRSHFLDDFGRLFLVECKNWSKPVGAKEVRDFIGKLQKTRTRLGVLFSRMGITGEGNGTDAVREIHSTFDNANISVVVLSADDLRGLNSYTEVIPLIEAKVDALRFDL